jgi:hypothetical protein
MGYWSGHCGKQGRRVKKPPTLFGHQPPPYEDLGLYALEEGEDWKEWDIHIKDVGNVNTHGLTAQLEFEDLAIAMRMAMDWLETDEYYGIDWDPLQPSQIPFSNFTTDQIVQMLRAGKLQPLKHGEKIRAACKGFTTPQVSKKRLRPVFEALFNSLIDKDKLPPLKYPSRLERRSQLAGKTFVASFDFAAWFDQLGLSSAVTGCHCIRVREQVEWNGIRTNIFKLTKAPMGAAYSCHIANTVTWALLGPVLKMHGVFTATMVDNVFIAADDEKQFVEAVKIFVERCDLYGATLNDRNLIPSTDEGIAQWGTALAQGPTIILGEKHRNGAVENTEKSIDKIKKAFERIEKAVSDESMVVTRRQVASCVSLAVWMSQTVQEHLSGHFELLRLFGKLERMPGGWDDRIPVNNSMIEPIRQMVKFLERNAAVIPKPAPLPSYDNARYKTIIIVDASGTGWGGYVWHEEKCYEVKAGWRNFINHSAWAEPIAAKEIIQWAKARWGNNIGRTAVVTDHFAIVAGQRRPLSNNAGFSRAYHLNNLYREVYYRAEVDTDFFFVDGRRNMTDAVSRNSRVGEPLTARIQEKKTLPSLRSFYHPYSRVEPRKWWNV